jgi:transposase
MPAPVPLPIRQAMWRRHRRGATAAELSRDFALPPRTVRGLLARWRERGEAGLAPDPTRHPGSPPPPDHPARGPALRLRREHPGWGAALIRIELEDHGIRPLPGVRTLQRWFRSAGLAPAPPGRRPEASTPRASAPHEIWEVDAAEETRTGDGHRASWLRIADEFTGAVLHTAIFPPRALEFRTGGGHAAADAAGLRPLGPAAPHPRR